MTAALSLTPTPRPPRRFLGDDDSILLSELLSRITKRYQKRQRLAQWYAQKALVQSLGMAVPQEFDSLRAVVGWPSTVVDKLIKRRTIDHIEVPGSQELTAQVNRIWVENDLDLESRMLHTGKAIQGIHFNVIARNDDQTIVLPTSAASMTCDYDRVKRRTTSAASIDEPARRGDPQQHTLYLPDRTVVVEAWGGRYLVVDELKNASGVVPVERFVNRPRDDRPWGSSNITPSVIYYTSAAVRTLAAMEVAREAFAMPKEFLINVGKSAFEDSDGNPVSAWNMYWTRLKALTGEVDEDGIPSALQPEIKQLAAAPPTPLIDMLKMYSQLLSTEVGMPPSMFGFVTENPPSGDSQRMYESDIVLTARTDNKTDGVGWSRSLRKALLADGVPLEKLPSEVRIVWTDPATFMPAATTDAAVKKVQVGMVPAESDVILEEVGYDRGQVERIQQDRRKARAAGLVADLAATRNTAVVNADPGTTPPVPGSTD